MRRARCAETHAAEAAFWFEGQFFRRSCIASRTPYAVDPLQNQPGITRGSSLAVCRILSSLQPIRPTSPLRFLSSQKIGVLPQARTTGIAILTSSGVLEGGKNDNALRRIPFVGSFTPAHGSQGEQHLRRWATTARTRVNDVRPADPRYSRRDVGRQNLGRKYLGARNASQSPAARRSRRNREASARRTQKLRRLM